jgi:hypothetical protein
LSPEKLAEEELRLIRFEQTAHMEIATVTPGRRRPPAR